MPSVTYNLDERAWENYWASHCAWRSGDLEAAFHLYKNLRAEHSLEVFYEVELKRPTRFVHPLGTVLGRAEYAEHFVVYQGVSVGSTVDNERPRFTGPCVMFPHSGVIGPVTVGKNVWITAGTIVEALPRRGISIPDGVVVSRHSHPKHVSWELISGVFMHHATRSVLDTYFPEHNRSHFAA